MLQKGGEEEESSGRSIVFLGAEQDGKSYFSLSKTLSMQ